MSLTLQGYSTAVMLYYKSSDARENYAIRVIIASNFWEIKSGDTSHPHKKQLISSGVYSDEVIGFLHSMHPRKLLRQGHSTTNTHMHIISCYLFVEIKKKLKQQRALLGTRPWTQEPYDLPVSYQCWGQGQGQGVNAIESGIRRQQVKNTSPQYSHIREITIHTQM